MKRAPLIFSLLALTLCLSAIGVAYGAYALSVGYSHFNSATWTYYELNREYTTANIVLGNHLGITTEWVKVGFFDGTSGTTNGTILSFKVTGNVLEIYDVDNTVLGVSDVKIGQATWLPNYTRISLTDGKLNVYDFANHKFISGFAFPHSIKYVGVQGGTGYVSDGYMQIDVNQGVAGVNAEISPIIPIVVLMSALGGALGWKKYKS